jgi:hypothetical protein
MKTLLVIAMFGLSATATHAGSKSVITPVIDTGPIYYLTMTDTNSTPLNVSEAAATTAPTTPRGPVAQTGYGPGARDDVYARLLKEAQKRGLR